jgi:hypothetical protein
MMIKREREREGEEAKFALVSWSGRRSEVRGDLPYLDLALAELQVVGDFDALPSGEIFVEVELLLELEGLRLAGAL